MRPRRREVERLSERGNASFVAVHATASAPIAITLLPADDATGVDVAATPTITFNEPVFFNTGNISLFDVDDDLIEAFNVETEVGGGAGQVAKTTPSAVRITPTVSMEAAKAHYIQIAATAIVNAAGLPYAGIANKTSWSFTTA
jgi:hypothetical protein